MNLWETGRSLLALRHEVRRGAPHARLDALLRELDDRPSLPSVVDPGLLIRALRRVRRYTAPEDSCLVRSIAAYATLRRFGHTPRFRIGVETEGERLRAHAWIELDGLASDPLARRFTPIFDHPS